MANVSDGGRPRGSRKITIKVGGVTDTEFITDDFNVDEPTKFLASTDENDAPNGGEQYADVITGSATLQIAAAATKIPENGDVFSEKIRPDDAAATKFYVSNVGHPEKKDGFKMIPIQFRKYYNPPA